MSLPSNGVVEVYFGGPAAPYAYIVHENPNARHPVGNYKYLENAVTSQRVSRSKWFWRRPRHDSGGVVVSTILEALGTYADAQTTLTSGTNLFGGRMPDNPDTCVCLYEYDGQARPTSWGQR